MSLKIESTDLELASLIDKVKKVNVEGGEEDSVITVTELQDIRDQADAEMAKVAVGDAKVTRRKSVEELLEDFGASLSAFQDSADIFAANMRQVAMLARQSKWASLRAHKFGVKDDPEIEAFNLAKKSQVAGLKRAVEFQLAYVVLAYMGSIEKL